ncbi:hypothetical protein ACJJTC_018083 [Scirpophaga incertulas]
MQHICFAEKTLSLWSHSTPHIAQDAASRRGVLWTPKNAFRKELCNTATIQKGVSGFKATGIFPIDPSIFEEDFLASNYLLGTRNDSVTVDQYETMDQDQAGTAPEVSSLPGLPGINTPIQTQRDLPTTAPEVNSLLGTSTSVQITANLSDITNILPEGNIVIVTPSKTLLSPLPLPKTTAARASTKQHSAIMTATPIKEVLENKLKKKEEKQLKLNRKLTKNMKINTNPNTNTKANKTTKKTTQKKNAGIDIKKRQRKNTTSKSSEEFSSSDEEILSTKRKKLQFKSPDTNITDETSPKNKEFCSICKEFGKNGIDAEVVGGGLMKNAVGLIPPSPMYAITVIASVRFSDVSIFDFHYQNINN